MFISRIKETIYSSWPIELLAHFLYRMWILTKRWERVNYEKMWHCASTMFMFVMGAIYIIPLIGFIGICIYIFFIFPFGM